jgi:signal transduction histidine kinase
VLQSLNRTLSGLLPMMAERQVTSEVVVAGRRPGAGDRFLAMGEPLLVFSMLANLLKNAAEASPAGGQISISLSEDGGRRTVEISIHNEGTIPDSIRGRFFEKFATAGKTHGTGIGAYSARLIARTLGGDIRCESTEPAGTTITIQLPKA